MPLRTERPGTDRFLGELFARVRKLERLHHGPWIYVGSGAPLPDGLMSPDFQNGWGNVGPPLQDMRFRWLHSGGLEIQGSVTGGTSGTVIFTLPNDPIFLPDNELRITAADDDDNLVVLAVKPNGDVFHR